MTIATSYTLAQLTAIETAYASGITSVTHLGKTTSFRNLSEMERIMATIRNALGVTTATTSPTIAYAEFQGVGDER